MQISAVDCSQQYAPRTIAMWYINKKNGQSFILLQALFHKQHSDEVELSGGSNRNKAKLSNIVVECRKTGEVVVLTPESLDQPSPQKWEKCKLALVKTVGGYLLEFYSPPNAKKVSVRSDCVNNLLASRINFICLFVISNKSKPNNSVYICDKMMNHLINAGQRIYLFVKINNRNIFENIHTTVN